ncbi:hypothetical protein AJ80_05193 [Polytolypa hystricis UAMH7299]|uniref:ABC transporter domain-containing protein n=1 Tax=Polytolypa hystricis (strain UAMH7299) TaxID=1447883 RepID=A0A2B7Y6K3_POLH7|nr:hypothetical protein AJ80_05193 [Polytolypa hystricis UAMH7299]
MSIYGLHSDDISVVAITGFVFCISFPLARIKLLNKTVKSEDQDTENVVSPLTWLSKGAIEFKSISVEYSVLKDGSLSIAPGGNIGICGRTGKAMLDSPANSFSSGKNSLVLSIFHMIELSGGRITIDSIDIFTASRQEVRS